MTGWRTFLAGGLVVATAWAGLTLSDRPSQMTVAQAERDAEPYCWAQNLVPHAWPEVDANGDRAIYVRCVRITEDDPRWCAIAGHVCSTSTTEAARRG